MKHLVIRGLFDCLYMTAFVIASILGTLLVGM